MTVRVFLAGLLLLLAGCDTEGDEPVLPRDIEVLTSSCKGNGGMKQAERVRPAFNKFEWRIDCTDGARFVLSVD